MSTSTSDFRKAKGDDLVLEAQGSSLAWRPREQLDAKLGRIICITPAALDPEYLGI